MLLAAAVAYFLLVEKKSTYYNIMYSGILISQTSKQNNNGLSYQEF